MSLLNKLSQLPEGKSGIIKNLTSNDIVNGRLKALGFEKKTVIKVLRKAKYNGPIHLQIGSTELMIREKTANEISLEPAKS
jgi:ferrous iron transport protein A|tara:strand:+ start:5999 stop:6241 length:243 start_codon:yes stop_codon:yes gene_type:complete